MHKLIFFAGKNVSSRKAIHILLAKNVSVSDINFAKNFAESTFNKLGFDFYSAGKIKLKNFH